MPRHPQGVSLKGPLSCVHMQDVAMQHVRGTQMRCLHCDAYAIIVPGLGMTLSRSWGTGRSRVIPADRDDLIEEFEAFWSPNAGAMMVVGSTGSVS